MKSWMILGIMTAFLFALDVSAQQPPSLSPQEQLDRARLELAYVEREHTMCKQSLADIWARGNAMEVQVKQLQEELKSLKETKDAPAKKK